jgi:hypothetical protein
MSRLDAFFGRLRAAGVDLALGFGINFSGGLTATRNASTKYVDVTIASDYLAAENIAAPADILAVPFIIGPVGLALSFSGTPNDTLILSDAPFDFKILDVSVAVSAAVDPSVTAQLRTATGGGGSVLSSLITLSATGTFRNNDTDLRTVAAGGSIYMRRSSDVSQSAVYILAVRT